MNKTTIDWPGLTHTINPIVGCLHSCDYCYAKKIALRFRMVKDWTNPEYHRERVDELRAGTKKPYKIFVGSMCDLFGSWVLSSFIQSVVDAVSLPHNQQNIYMFLTKNPKRYKEFDFPPHCFLGTTVTSDKDEFRIEELRRATGGQRFVSYEPMTGPIVPGWFYGIKNIYIGMDSRIGKDVIRPKREWLEPFLYDDRFYIKKKTRKAIGL